MADWSQTFRERFCKVFECPPERYVPVAFRMCLHTRVRLLQPVIQTFRPDFFNTDYEMIECLGPARNWADVELVLGAFGSNNKLRGSLLRRVLKLRASGRRTNRLVKAVMSHRR